MLEMQTYGHVNKYLKAENKHACECEQVQTERRFE